MEGKLSTFKQRLRGSVPLHGFFMGQPNPAVVEMIGWAGFDFVIVDMEHGPAGLETLEHLLRAADGAGVAGLVRVAGSDAASMLHALDCGAAGILVPHVTDADVARRVVQHAYYPPLGTRGINSITRAGRHGMAGPNFLRDQAERTAVLAMIEDLAALEHVDAIARVPGIDAVFVGPADLAASMGHPGNPRHPDVLAAVDAIWPAVLAAKGPALATTARSPQDAGDLARIGIRMLCFNTTTLLATALATLRDALAIERRNLL